MTLTTLRLSEVGQKVTYRARGSGEPLVLIHGVGMQSAAWEPQIEHFATSHLVIALDMPGHGGSDPLPAGSPLPAFVIWAKRVIRALGLGPVNLVGHSMGALIVGGLAATRQDLVTRAALLNGVFRRDPVAKAAVVARAAEIRAGKVDLETPLSRWFEKDESQARALVATWLTAVDPSSYATAYAAFAEGDATYADQYSDIACPFVAITGDGDPNSTPAMAQKMASLAQSGCAVTIKGHRHMVNLTAADDVNAHLQDWLKQPARPKELQ
ncbi:alpha/beta fold hydrolase [Roseobacter sp.]|uniref:alpha/beta fold hydrolase n=1 Tax=Roseobacter sp. TaxID=1907202 RepID=UPI00385A33F2